MDIITKAAKACLEFSENALQDTLREVTDLDKIATLKRLVVSSQEIIETQYNFYIEMYGYEHESFV